MTEEKCRVCDGDLSYLFEKQHLEKYPVKYYQCNVCKGAQTEKPHWIEEAYKNATYAWDTGICERSLYVFRLSLALASLQKFSRDDLCVDVGGGPGLLTRLLRDYGLNAFWSDKFSNNIFAVGFEKELEKVHNPKLITAFEVFEHFSNPRQEVDRLLQKEPEFLLFSTKIYKGQDCNWWYFITDGQHVQFYSLQGLALLARNTGYHFQSDGQSYHLFSKQIQSPGLVDKVIKLAPKAKKRAKKRWSSRIQEDHEKMVKGTI